MSQVKQLPMVGWYDPRQLAKTGIEVAISTVFGRNSDNRLVEAMASGDDQEKFYDYTCYYLDNGKDPAVPVSAHPRNSPDLRVLLAMLIILALGFIVGSFIMGAYLLLSFNFFGRHGNEAFSSIGVEDWKNSVRLHINENGDLTIFPIGLRRVPRKWKDRQGTTGPELVPDDNRATEPELIEPPIVMRAAKTHTGVRTSSPDTRIEASTQTSKPTEE